MQSLDARASTLPSHVETGGALEGQLIAGKYRVERLIGAGGMGVVVSALHVDLERYVAIKLIRDEFTRDPNTLQRFLLEARAAAKMTNEHICRVLDVDKLDNGSPFIVMELLQGCDLGAILKERGRVDPAECVDWVLQACEGVAEAHALHIVHRDLKPDNLFMTRLGDGSACVKVLDFGISKVLGGSLSGSLTAPRTMVGSPRYMAPEQMLFSAADERSDVWALGTILYELMSGTPAFAGDSVATICARVINEAPVPPRARAPEIPHEVQRVILRCLEREPHARYASVAALAQDLAPLGSSSALSSYRKIAVTLGGAAPALAVQRSLPDIAAAASTRDARPRRRWRWAAAALGVAAAFVAWQVLSRPPLAPERSAAAGAAPAPAPGTPLPDLQPVASVSAPAPAASTAVSALAPAVAAVKAPERAEGARSAVHSSGTLPAASSARTARVSALSSAPASRSAAAPTPAGAAYLPSAATPPPLDKAQPRPSAARPRSDSAASSLQEAWDVRKFGGRE